MSVLARNVASVRFNLDRAVIWPTEAGGCTEPNLISLISLNPVDDVKRMRRYVEFFFPHFQVNGTGSLKDKPKTLSLPCLSRENDAK